MTAAGTSASIAVLKGVAGGNGLLHAMVNDGEVLVSTATAVETVVVAMGKDGVIHHAAVEFLSRPSIRLTESDAEQYRPAVDAYPHYGKGKRNAAQLYFGDIFVHAPASVRGLPLLYKCEDFTRTDIVAAM